jgi:hypothetical protein
MSSEANRLAIVWDTIERIAFMPDNEAKWLTVFERTLHTLWGVQAADVIIRHRTGFIALLLNVDCKYSVETKSKFSVSIINIAAQASCCWNVHADPNFHSKAAFYASPEKYPPQDMKKYLRDDIAHVLDGMVFHPRTHAHGDLLGIMPNFTTAGLSLPCHAIRLGGGIENAFVFLMHLRYQFCLLSEEVREKEKARLVDLFTAAITDKQLVVPPADLFDFKPFMH